MRNRNPMRIATVLWLLAATAGIPAAAQTAGEICTPERRTANLDFTFEDIEGNVVALSDYRGKVILLDFWATWCGPCRFLIPGFIDLHSEYGPEGLQVLGLSVDDTPAELERYAEDMGMNYPVLVGRGNTEVQQAYGPLIGLPTAFIIDREGRVCKSHSGFAEKEFFEEAIRALL